MPTEREAIIKIFKERPDLAALLADMVDDGRLGNTDNIPPDEEITIVAGDDHGGVAGSKQVVCGGCGAQMWLSPSTLEMMAKHKGRATIKCLPCIMKTLPERDAKTR